MTRTAPTAFNATEAARDAASVATVVTTTVSRHAPRSWLGVLVTAALAVGMTGCAVVPAGHGRGHVYGSVGTTVYTQGSAPVYGQVYGQAPAPVYAPAYPPGYGYSQPVVVGSPHVAVAAPVVIRPWGFGLGWGRQAHRGHNGHGGHNGHHRY